MQSFHLLNLRHSAKLFQWWDFCQGVHVCDVTPSGYVPQQADGENAAGSLPQSEKAGVVKTTFGSFPT